MLKILQFGFYAVQMRRKYEAAKRAKNAGNDERAFQLLREARQFGFAALKIEAPFIHGPKVALGKTLSALQGVYQREIIVRMPDDDLDLVAPVLRHMKVWADMGVTPNVHHARAFVGEFEMAKRCLGADLTDNHVRETLLIVYRGKNIFPQTQVIMQAFIAGKATRENTEAQFDMHLAKLRKWLPELIWFPEELG